MAGLAPQGLQPQAAGGRLNAEVSYGLKAPFGTGLLTPYAGTVLADGADRTYRFGTSLRLTDFKTTGLKLSLEGTLQEPRGQQAPIQGLQFHATGSF